jgi:hypothetical protein
MNCIKSILRLNLVLALFYTSCHGECIRHSDCAKDELCSYGDCVLKKKNEDVQDLEETRDTMALDSNGQEDIFVDEEENNLDTQTQIEPDEEPAEPEPDDPEEKPEEDTGMD